MPNKWWHLGNSARIEETVTTQLLVHCESTKQDTKHLPVTSPNVKDFLNYLTGRLNGKFATYSYLNIPPHLKYVATLPCEISILKNNTAQAVIEVNCHLTLSHLKNHFTIFVWKNIHPLIQ